MGIFSSSEEEENSDRATRLAEQAEGTIKPKRLKKTGGLMSTYLYDKPLIDYIEKDEQPNYIFRGTTAYGLLIHHSEGTSEQINDGGQGIYRYFLITNTRILYVAGEEEGDTVLDFQYKDLENIQGGKREGRGSFHEIKIESRDGNQYRFTFMEKGPEIEEACKYVNDRISEQKSEYEGSLDSNIYAEKEATRVDEPNTFKEKETISFDSVRTDLKKVDSLITNAEYREARQLLDETENRFKSIKRELPQNESTNLKREAQEIESKINNRLSKSHVLKCLREMNPYEFEELVAKVWRKQGWDAQVTSGSTDRGVDVVATKEDAFETRRHLIQVKRHGENTRVGSEGLC